MLALVRLVDFVDCLFPTCFENDIAASLLVYPSLTESGRVRADFDISYRQDLFSDFYVRFSFYDQYDSRPPEGASDNDFGTTIAVGWDW